MAWLCPMCGLTRSCTRLCSDNYFTLHLIGINHASPPRCAHRLIVVWGLTVRFFPLSRLYFFLVTRPMCTSTGCQRANGGARDCWKDQGRTWHLVWTALALHRGEELWWALGCLVTGYVMPWIHCRSFSFIHTIGRHMRGCIFCCHNTKRYTVHIIMIWDRHMHMWSYKLRRERRWKLKFIWLVGDGASRINGFAWEGSLPLLLHWWLRDSGVQIWLSIQCRHF